MTAPQPILIGIDPGYDRIGWAVGQMESSGKLQLSAAGCITTTKTATRFIRYQELQTELAEIASRYTPAEAAIETLFFSKNQTTALQVSEARGIIISTLLGLSCQIFEYNPMQIKQAVTGSGGADKRAVTKMIQMQVAGAPKHALDDTMDAIAILLTHATVRKYSAATL